MSAVAALQGITVLAAPPTPPPGEGPEWGKAAPIGLLVILLLGVAMWFLFRNMSKHLRKVRDMADAEAAEAAEARAAKAAARAKAAAGVAVSGDDLPADGSAADVSAGAGSAGTSGVSIAKSAPGDAGAGGQREHPAR